MVEMIESVDRAQSGDRRLGCEWRDAGHRGTYRQQPARPVPLWPPHLHHRRGSRVVWTTVHAIGVRGATVRS